MADNTVTIVGNATRDPELRFLPNGQPSCSFGLAVSRRWQDRQTQEWKEQTSFIDVQCWAQLAENVAQTVQKGNRVLVFGRLDQRSWENQAGEKRSKIEVTADDVCPSLKWATCRIERNERRTPADASGGAPSSGYRPPANTAPQPAATSQYSTYDEEPF